MKEEAVLYISPHPNFTQVVQHREPIRWNATGSVVLEYQKRLAAEFGQLGDEQLVYNPLTGESMMIADIITGVYDTEVAQAKEGWTDEEREMVERKLDEIAEVNPGYVRKLVPVRVASPSPWQTFDQTPEEKIVPLAQELDLVPEALRYERENRARAAVVAALEAAMDPEDASRAKPLEEIKVPKPGKPNLRIKEPPKMTDSGIVVDTPGLELKNPAHIGA